MAKSKGPVPDGFHTVTPYLIVPGAAPLIDFLQQAFGAEQTIRALRESGLIRHACVRIGESMVEMAEACEQWKAMPATLHVYVRDVDEVYRRAVKAGAEPLYEPQDMDYGDREAGLTDPSGNQWYIATHKPTVKGASAGQYFAPAGFRTVTPGSSASAARRNF